MSKKIETCQNCKYWARMISDGDKTNKWGICRALPPQVLSISDKIISTYPETDEDNKCIYYYEKKIIKE